MSRLSAYDIRLMALDFIIGALEGVRDGSPLDQVLAFCAFVGFLAIPAAVLYAWYNRGVNALKENNAEPWS